MKRHPAIHAFAAAGLFATAVSVGAASLPIPDPAYGGHGDGVAQIPPAAVPADGGYAQRAVAQADGRLVLAGEAITSVDGHETRQLVLARLDAQGLLDPTFGPQHDGFYRSAFDGDGRDIAQTGDGRLVYIGNASDLQVMLVGRLHADGTPDTDFAGSGRRLISPSALINGATAGFLTTVLPLADGKTLLIGTAVAPPAPGQYFSCAMRLSTDGSNDTDFGDAGRICIAPAQSTVSLPVAGRVLADGRILLAGFSEHAGGSGWDMSVARLDADGALDTTFGPAHDGWAYVAFDQGGTLNDLASAIAVDGAGRILLAGYFDGANGNNDIGIARLQADGRPDGSFGSQGRVQVALDLGGSNDDFAHSITVLPDGGILVGGRASTGTGDASVALLLTSNGGLDPRFGDDGVFVQGPPNLYGEAQILAGDYLYMVGYLAGSFAATRAVLPLFADGFENPDTTRPAQP